MKANFEDKFDLESLDCYFNSLSLNALFKIDSFLTKKKKNVDTSKGLNKHNWDMNFFK